MQSQDRRYESRPDRCGAPRTSAQIPETDEVEQSEPAAALIELCRRLLPDDPSLQDEVRLAQTDPAAFRARYRERLAERGVDDSDDLEPWVCAFVDGLVERRRAAPVDWQAHAVDVIGAIDEYLAQLPPRPERWAWLDDRWLDAPTSEVLQAIADHLTAEGATLACIDTGSDEYCLTVLNPASAADIRVLSLRAAPPGMRGILLPPCAAW